MEPKEKSSIFLVIFIGSAIINSHGDKKLKEIITKGILYMPNIFQLSALAYFIALISTPINSMNPYDSSLLASEDKLTIRTQNRAMQIVMLNCLQRNDFIGVTHIIEKIRLIPGKAFLESLPKGILLVKQLIAKEPKNIDWSYQLFKAAAQEKHTLMGELLSNLELLPHVDICANFARDFHIQYIVRQHPQFAFQNKTYISLALAFTHRLNKQSL